MIEDTSAANMTPREAAVLFLAEKAADDKRAPLMKVIKRVLIEHFEKTGATEFEGVGYAIDNRTQLDVAKVKVLLGEDLEKYSKVVTSRTLSPLKKKPKRSK